MAPAETVQALSQTGIAPALALQEQPPVREGEGMAAGELGVTFGVDIGVPVGVPVGLPVGVLGVGVVEPGRPPWLTQSQVALNLSMRSGTWARSGLQVSRTQLEANT